MSEPLSKQLDASILALEDALNAVNDVIGRSSVLCAEHLTESTVIPHERLSDSVLLWHPAHGFLVVRSPNEVSPLLKCSLQTRLAALQAIRDFVKECETP